MRKLIANVAIALCIATTILTSACGKAPRVTTDSAFVVRNTKANLQGDVEEIREVFSPGKGFRGYNLPGIPQKLGDSLCNMYLAARSMNDVLDGDIPDSTWTRAGISRVSAEAARRHIAQSFANGALKALREKKDLPGCLDGSPSGEILIAVKNDLEAAHLTAQDVQKSEREILLRSSSKK